MYRYNISIYIYLYIYTHTQICIDIDIDIDIDIFCFCMAGRGIEITCSGTILFFIRVITHLAYYFFCLCLEGHGIEIYVYTTCCICIRATHLFDVDLAELRDLLVRHNLHGSGFPNCLLHGLVPHGGAHYFSDLLCNGHRLHDVLWLLAVDGLGHWGGHSRPLLLLRRESPFRIVRHELR